MWRIGDEQGISIYNDQLLPKPLSFKVVSPKYLPADLIVPSLIEAPRVCPKYDLVLWHFDKKGEFTVKSAYRFALNLHQGSVASSSIGAPPWWKRLWYFQIPDKVRIFSWKAFKNILPSKFFLWKMGSVDSACCGLCSMGVDTVDHALWLCKKIASFLSSRPLYDALNKLKVLSFMARI
ncbi:hypothetical protein Dsin_025241 [Dipteronia sinensis]|uniref:Reverse transcriptase zinc-binding domain-containing protein n=1 Tax=Dipteronia sinensis TaxID=43782 RepID=A0AAD9ZVM9_9ROSI|nr:hypothetical protein Dsin_025241 [Dipteronia sinensis]